MGMEDRRKKVICDLVEDKVYVPMKEKELAMFLQVSKEDRPEFSRLLRELVSEGKLTVNAKGKYQKAAGHLLQGTFVSTSRGFGFVEVEDGDDIFIPEDQVHGAFHTDIVQVALTKGEALEDGKRREGTIIRIVERGIQRIVGTYEQSKNYGFVVPDQQKISSDIFVPKERSKGAVTGHKVVVEITDYGTKTKSPEGKVVEIIGHINDPGVDILSIVKAYDIPMEFGEKVMNQAERVASEVSEADRAGRRDLRDQLLITIDGEDAKDLDDAVSCTFDGKNYHLGVHIADVTNYVQENSALDHEAINRGTSVYLADRVIPMLPHALSNGICSLNAGVDRLALSCLMTIDQNGHIKDYEICESVIKVAERMSYTGVKRLLTEPELVYNDPAFTKYDRLMPMLRLMETLSGILRHKRHERGAIDFDFPECKILLDEKGKPTGIVPHERNVATKMIEDFMLAANETIAEHFFWQEIPFVYRVHGVPDEEKIRNLATLLGNYGFYMKLKQGGKKENAPESTIHPKEIQKLLDKIEGSPKEAMISRLVLRSMKQAKYSTESTGHFGLACQYYCHFTSPIRRYPDLQIHRIIKEQLRGRLKENRLEHYMNILPGIAEKSSKAERRAEEAERETDKLKKVQFMEEHIGEEFNGVVSGVTSFGIFVELENTVEGLVPIARIPGDYYVYHEDTYELVGQGTGKTYSLGMPVKIWVSGADRLTKTVDFGIVTEEENE